MSFGSDLRHEREARHIDLHSVADATKVSVRFLEALEADNYAQLPGGVFTRGMIRGYCTHLGLDHALWLQNFAAHHAAEPAERDWVAFAENVKSQRTPPRSDHARWWFVALLAAALVVLIWLSWHFVIRHHRPAAQRNPAAAALTASALLPVFLTWRRT